jgi:hypothetical protein
MQLLRLEMESVGAMGTWRRYVDPWVQSANAHTTRLGSFTRLVDKIAS